MLDRLEARLGGKDFQVVAVNTDRGGGDKPKAFLAETGATHLALYTDPSGKLFSKIKAVGMSRAPRSSSIARTRSAASSVLPTGIRPRRRR